MRPRLLAKLDECLDKPLALIIAPAGYGKTTLAAHWLETAKDPYAWVSLDENDADLATFLAYLIAAARSVCPQMGQTAEAALRAPLLPQATTLADLFLHDLQQSATPLFIALDDYHTVNGKEIGVLMQRLISHLPRHVHLLIIARADPGIPLSRLRSQGRVIEVRSADLRFTSDEAREWLQRTVDPELPDDQIAMLAERTEGWPVGLQLAAISLRGNSDPEAFTRRFAQNNNRMLTDYLVGEVLDKAPVAQRARMYRVSILERFSAPLCEAIFGETELPGSSSDFIATLWASNLFVTALDDEGIWFRYHHLFRDLLRHQLRQTLPAEEIAQLHRRASGWYAGAGQIEEAISHAIEGDDPIRAAQLVEANMHQALNHEDWRRVGRWLAMLPKAVAQRPAILIAQAFLHNFQHRVAAIPPLVAAAERGLNNESSDYTHAQREALFGAINTLRSSGFLPGNADRMVSTARMALQQLDPEMLFARSLAEFWCIYGLQQSGQTGDAVELAHRWLAQQPEHPDVRTLRLLLALCGVYFDEAHLPKLLSTATTFWELASRMQRPLSLHWSRFLLGWMHYQRNELDAAAKYFGQVTESPYEAHGKAAIDCFVGMALTRHAQGWSETARRVVLSLREFLLDLGAVNYMQIADSLALRIGDGTEPVHTIGELANDLEDQIAGDLWEAPGLTTVRLALRSGAPERLAAASAILCAGRAASEVRHRTRRCIEIAVLEASLHAMQGDRAAALEDVRRAVVLGEPGGGLRFFLDDGPTLLPYLRELLDQGVAPTYVHAILAAFASKHEGSHPAGLQLIPDGGPSALAPDLLATLTNREIDVLLLLEERLTNKEIAARLSISPRTVQKHTINLYGKLNASNRREAISQARAIGLLSALDSNSLRP